MDRGCTGFRSRDVVSSTSVHFVRDSSPVSLSPCVCPWHIELQIATDVRSKLDDLVGHCQAVPNLVRVQYSNLNAPSSPLMGDFGLSSDPMERTYRGGSNTDTSRPESEDFSSEMSNWPKVGQVT
jgi:hypothetical protein